MCVMAKNLVIVESPSKSKTIEKYLGSGIIKGIGPATAKKIVSKFGEESIYILKENLLVVICFIQMYLFFQ